MRKTITLSRLFLMAGFLFLYACKKNADETKADETKTEQKSNRELAGKVTDWLEKQQLLYTDNRSQKIDSLKKALLLSDIAVESYKDGQQLVSVPVGSGFKSANNAGKSPSNYLVMVLDAGIITKGNVIQYIPKAGQKQVLRNTFSKIFTYQKLDTDGQFTVLTVTDDFTYELKFENGNLRSVAEKRSKTGTSGSQEGKTNGCIDWYLITTVYYSDGTSEVVSVQYLFTTCSDMCQTTKIANGRSFRITCGGGGGGEIDYEWGVSAPVSWSAYKTSDSYSTVWSHETLNGTRSTSGVAKFTSINYHTDDVQTTVTYNPAYAVWHRYDWSGVVSSTDQKTAVSTLTGKLTFPNSSSSADIVIPSASKTWDADKDL